MRPSAEDGSGLPPSRRSRAAALVRRTLLDVEPLRTSKQFRLLWIGELISHTGRHITVVALPFQVWELTHSPLAVGGVAAVQLVPLLLLTIVGGALADSMDRRRLLLLSQVGLIATSLLLVAGAVAGSPPLWYLFAVAAASAAFMAIENPARTSAIASLVPREQLPAAMALNQVVMQVSDVAGPAVGGIIIAGPGLVWAYAADAVSFVAAIVTLLAMRPMPPHREEGVIPVRRFAAIREGLRYVRGRRVLQAVFLVDLNAMIFGMPRALFPVLADTAFHVGPIGLGFMYAAPAAGALAGALFTGWVRHVRNQGRAVLLAVAVWGLAIVGFGISTDAFWLALLFLAVAGAADVVSAIFRSTITQSTVPDSLRGRVSAMYLMVVIGGPRLGDLEAGAVAQLVTPAFSVISGGAASVIGVLLVAALMPTFARYRRGDPA